MGVVLAVTVIQLMTFVTEQAETIEEKEEDVKFGEVLEVVRG